MRFCSFMRTMMIVVSAVLMAVVPVHKSPGQTIEGTFHNVYGAFGSGYGMPTDGSIPPLYTYCTQTTQWLDYCNPACECFYPKTCPNVSFNNTMICYSVRCKDGTGNPCPLQWISQDFVLCYPQMSPGVCYTLEDVLGHPPSQACCTCVEDNWENYWVLQMEQWTYYVCKLWELCNNCTENNNKDNLVWKMLLCWDAFVDCKMKNFGYEAVQDILKIYCPECSPSTGGGGIEDSIIFPPPGGIGMLMDHPEMFNTDEAWAIVLSHFS